MIERKDNEIILLTSDGTRVLGIFPYGPGKKFATEQEARTAANKREGQIKARVEGEKNTFAEIPALCIFEHEPGKDPHDERALDRIVENFSTPERPGRIKRILGHDSYNPVVLGHEENQEILKRTDQPAAGWPQRLWRIGPKLYAHVKHVPLEVKRMIENKAYRSVSAEIYANYCGKVGPALRRIGLMGATVPAKKNLGEIAFAKYSEDEGEYQVFTRFMEGQSMLTPEQMEKMSLEELRAALQTSEADLASEKTKFSEKEQGDKELASSHALALEENKKKIDSLEKEKMSRYLELERGKTSSQAQDIVREQNEKEATQRTNEELRGRVAELEAKNVAVEINRFADRFQHEKGIQDEGAIKTVKETLFKVAINKFDEEKGETGPKAIMGMLQAVCPTVTQPGVSIVLDEGLNFDENEAKDKAEYVKWAEAEEMNDADAKKYDFAWWKKSACKVG